MAVKDIIKVPISVTLEVSRAEWDLAYGTGTEFADVKESVRAYVLNMLDDLTSGNSGAGDGAIKNVKARG